MVSIEDESLWGGGSVLKQLIWDAGRDMIQAWTRQRLAESSLYGVRVYKKGSLLSMHVDRAPLVSSAIINVDQDVDEPWWVHGMCSSSWSFDPVSKVSFSLFIMFSSIYIVHSV
jgi:hypothetical protein